ncbi:MAG: hypothetical protein A3I61_03915 [Acidobacteria bacterium RIFCSPLOWO2_02_FULL_68_18]|nr:MAG: hypothetical protein A3I61_03915 [Acidobacteria bacterium RIFCSPLOWO2_02_FULL_68_18]OFW48813.1 MAG: hypothetical protein A3G77_17850 [Acidobacteria bacterium RIFCSPLOWO2_12_FULL_68_19]
MVRRTLLFMAIGVLVAVVPASAHHSFAAYYFEDQSVTLEGTVQEFHFRSPHTVLVFTAPDSSGRTQTFTAEWGNPRRLSTQGVTVETLKPGDVVVVTGSPGRANSQYKVHLKGIRRPSDGWSWVGGRR